MLYSLALSHKAPAMSPEVAGDLVRRGRAAVERSDSGSFMDLLAPDATIFDRSPEEFEKELDKAFSELRGHFSIDTRNLQVRPEGRTALITFTMDVGQKDGRMNAVYFPGVRVRARVERRKSTRWWGLVEAEEWKVSRLDSDPPLLSRNRDN
jgi:ketosteroid isomerase-like protein